MAREPLCFHFPTRGLYVHILCLPSCEGQQTELIKLKNFLIRVACIGNLHTLKPVLYPSLVLPRASKMQPKGTEDGEANATGRGRLSVYNLKKFRNESCIFASLCIVDATPCASKMQPPLPLYNGFVGHPLYVHIPSLVQGKRGWPSNPLHKGRVTQRVFGIFIKKLHT